MQQPTGPLEALAELLTTPAKSGIYATKSEIIALARLSEASLRVNERKRMLADIIRSVGSAEEMCALADRFIALCERSGAQYRELARAYPASAALLDVWGERARRTIEALEEVKEEIRL